MKEMVRLRFLSKRFCLNEKNQERSPKVNDEWETSIDISQAVSRGFVALRLRLDTLFEVFAFFS